MADQLDYVHFEGKEGSAFKAKGKNESIEVKLVEVTKKDSASIEGFSLLFEGPEHTQLAQGSYTFSHDELGESEIFIVPVQADPHATDVVHYEAVFNRLKDKDDSA